MPGAVAAGRGCRVVTGPDLLWADVYATAAVARGPRSLHWLEALGSHAALLVSASGLRQVTPAGPGRPAGRDSSGAHHGPGLQACVGRATAGASLQLPATMSARRGEAEGRRVTATGRHVRSVMRCLRAAPALAAGGLGCLGAQLLTGRLLAHSHDTAHGIGAAVPHVHDRAAAAALVVGSCSWSRWSPPLPRPAVAAPPGRP